jgi:hypothetical protein
LSTSGSRVLLNGVAEEPIKHGRGMRQGITALEILMEVLLKIDSLRRVFHWAGSDKVSMRKCK